MVSSGILPSGGLRDPTTLEGWRVFFPLARFLSDPLRTSSQLSCIHGDFVKLRMPLAVGRLPSTIVFSAAVPHFRQILSDPATWRTVNIAAAGRRNHASSRLSRGLVRMRGQRHNHYRRLVTAPLRRDRILEMSDSLGQTAERIADGWQREATSDLLPLARDMMQRLAAAHLFGRDDEAACAIARMISTYVAASWSLSINLFRLDLPGTPYHRFMRHTEALEARILEWAARKKGDGNGSDLLALVVNSPDEAGGPPAAEMIAGQVPTLFGATYETCQNALVWLLILVSQHPRTEKALREELAAAVGRVPVTLRRIADLPVLDAVVKESLRILPPVPNQYRVALRDTQLTGHPVAVGTRAVLSAFLRNRDASLFPRPGEFRPERWTGFNPSPFQYAVFSAGPRACPGFGFGSSALKVALAAILKRYRIVLETEARVDYRVHVALAPHPRVMARLLPPDCGTPSRPIRGRIRELVRFPA